MLGPRFRGQAKLEGGQTSICNSLRVPVVSYDLLQQSALPKCFEFHERKRIFGGTPNGYQNKGAPKMPSFQNSELRGSLICVPNKQVPKSALFKNMLWKSKLVIYKKTSALVSNALWALTSLRSWMKPSTSIPLWVLKRISENQGTFLQRLASHKMAFIIPLSPALPSTVCRSQPNFNMLCLCIQGSPRWRTCINNVNDDALWHLRIFFNVWSICTL